MMVHVQSFTRRFFESRERQRSEALARVQQMLQDGTPGTSVMGEVNLAAQKGLDLNIPGIDLNEVTNKHTTNP